MTEQEWLASTDPSAMLDWLCQHHAPSDRKLRLWVVACRSLEMSKAQQTNRYTPDGKDLEGNWEALEKAISAWKEASESPVVPSLHERAHILRDIIGNPFHPVTLPPGEPCKKCNGRGWVSGPVPYCERCNGIGHGPSPVLTPLVWQLAEAAYTVRTGTGTLDNDALAVLSDALEEAGLEDKSQVCPRCINGSGIRLGLYGEPPRVKCHHCGGEGKLRFTNSILAHLRDPGPHHRGCWAVDLLLGKE